MLILTILVALSPTPGTRASSSTLDFRADTFPLRNVAAADLPYHAWPNPPLPPTWTPTDSDGIKMRWWNGRLYYHPVELEEIALRYLNGYDHTGNRTYLAWARRYAAKIRELSIDSSGALFVPYRFDYASEGLHAPWYSGMAQGMAISVYVRLFRITGDLSALDSARRFFASFRRGGPNSQPWVSRAGADRYLWIEEYPRNDRWDRVLNGFMYAIYGLYEYWQLTRYAEARHVLEGTLTTLKANIHLYRVPGGVSYYDLYHYTRHVKYHFIHIDQLRHIALMSGDRFFAHEADLFYSDYPGT
jgi:hypothetical protein